MNATASKRVLVVDDDPVVGKSFDRVLGPKGYAVISATDGAQALERLAHEDYDLVYTDIKMPGMSGIEVARRIRASRPWLPVVIVTGFGSEENESQARELGVAAFVHKPLAPETIEDLTQRIAVERAPHAPAAEAVAAPMPAQPEEAGVLQTTKNVALFLAAPFIGLVYAMALPVVGLAVLGRLGYRAFMERKSKRT